MLTKSDSDLGSRAVLDLHGFFIITNNLEIIENPKIIFKCLKPTELFVMEHYDNLTHMERIYVEEDLVRENVCEIFGYDGETVNLDFTPAGVISAIAEAVLKLSLRYVLNEDSIPYIQHYGRISVLENMQAIVSYYLHIPYSEVVQFPLNELYHKHAICARSFPNQVNPLIPIEENNPNG